ncbi:hypothetical protein A3I42_02305 [Candidatus Uhrbacteria bacterium RIFCSPLOWO2_02_FULL_49_11]|uniref:Uncharacterized protein n=1 Tax=Candidatus Uhrbacteria bacterium RIFCSPLOWO2_02_FULL_49_11 TaxID=1802409 RepID=A0A1F7VF17_9BACT|nr:MAG: hypothetical protein A3I42_02305 [Candidatus Uhrbacteria bacterium RIFCSPLOWO2_02_FULL_49_11]
MIRVGLRPPSKFCQIQQANMLVAKFGRGQIPQPGSKGGINRSTSKLVMDLMDLWTGGLDSMWRYERGPYPIMGT